MSQINKEGFRQLAVETQLAMILLPLAWVVFLAGQAVTQGTISLVQLGMGGLCCMLVFSQSNWGRWFCSIYNVLLLSSMYLQGRDAMEWPLVDIATSFLFAGATITLFLPKTYTLFRREHTMMPDKTSSTNM